MSTITQLPLDAPALPPPGDPFRYGWRYVRRDQPDGRVAFDRIPLTLEDVLHPQMGDVVVESTLHDLICAYLAYVFRSVGDDSTLVLADTGVYWDDPALGHHSPDIAFITGVKEKRRNWTSFVVADHGVRPRVIIEVVSPLTRQNDVVTKVEQYHQARVPVYVIVDRQREDSPLRLIGHWYTPTGYLPMPTDERGRLWLEAVGLWLGIKGDEVRCYKPGTDEEFGDYSTVRQELAQAKLRAEDAAQRADAEKQRADLAQSEAETEKARADAEKQRADEAIARLKALEAELQRRQAPAPPE